MTFEVIVTTFPEGRGMSVDDVPITEGRDEQVTAEITDDKLRDDFRAYHARVARLDMVKKSVNLRQASPNRLKEGRVKVKVPT